MNCVLLISRLRRGMTFLSTQNKIQRFSQLRTYMPNIRKPQLNEIKYLEKDKIPEGYQIIYKAPMQIYFTTTNAITTLTTLGIGAMILKVYCADPYFLEKRDSIEETFGLITDSEDLVYFGIGFLLLTTIFRILLAKYPMRIYRNKEQYIAIFEAQIPFVTSRKTFVRGEVSKAKSTPLNPWRELMYKMKDHNVMLLDDYFKTTAEFNEMMYKS